jgi:hypothetical protein
MPLSTIKAVGTQQDATRRRRHRRRMAGVAFALGAGGIAAGLYWTQHQESRPVVVPGPGQGTEVVPVVSTTR